MVNIEMLLSSKQADKIYMIEKSFSELEDIGEIGAFDFVINGNVMIYFEDEEQQTSFIMKYL